jgi:hypothetical protein
MARPHVVMLADPNGAGNTTTAPALLSRTLGLRRRCSA